MFKNSLHIITALFIILIFIGCAGESKNESLVSGAMVEEDLSAEPLPFEFNIYELPDSLTNEQQTAFQLRAKQKFQDFLDYLKIVSNPELDDDLVNHSEKLLKELFISDTVTFYDGDTILYGTIDSNNNPIELFSFLKKGILVSHREEITSKINSYRFVSPLEKDTTNNLYFGKLETDIIINKQKTIKTIDIYLIETKKQFGDTEQRTVEIKLGNIY
jgi:hypothetical protein